MAEQDSVKEALLAANYIRLLFINSINVRFNKSFKLMGKKLLTIALCLLVSIGAAFAQTQNVSGVVNSDDGQPVAGASIVVPGTTIGTYADASGKFSIANVPANATELEISFLGMRPQTVKIAPYVSVTLLAEANSINETVVVAYGTQKRESITGSVAQIDEKKLELRTTTSATGALEGAAPGVQVNNTYGEPGAAPTIRIRGFGSVNGSNTPLFVLDGAPFEGNIAEINPADIASISVLKDAASSALYGNRAANGVVLITTKSGRGSTDPSITVKINQGVYTRGLPEYETLNPEEWMEVSWTAMKNYAAHYFGGDQAQAAAYASEYLISDYAKLNIFDADDNALFDANGKLVAKRKSIYNDLNWFDAVERTGYRQDYSVSGSVASSKFNVYASLGYTNEQGYIVASGYERMTGRINTSFTPNKWFKAGVNVNATVSERNFNDNATGSYYANPFYIARYTAPIYPYYLHNADGSFALDANGEKQYDTKADYLDNRNIAYELRTDRQNSHRNVLGGQAFATITLPYGFSATVKGIVNHSTTSTEKYNNPDIGDGAANNGRFTNTNYRYHDYTLSEMLNWEREFGSHHVDVLAGHENYSYLRKYQSTMNTDMAVPGILVIGNFLSNSYVYGFNDTYKTESYLARVRYNYAEKYFFDASIRRDGSSRFHPDNRWGNFFSVGANWNIKKENFMANVDKIDALKLRAAFGEVGNDAGVGLYGYQGLYEIDKNGGKPALLKKSLVANDIKWETTQTIDVAVEGRAFDRVNFSLGYFDKRSKDLLFDVPLPLSAGSWSHQEDDWNMTISKNIGSVSNRGIEFSTDVDVIRNGHWLWNVGMDVTFLKNKIITLPDHKPISVNSTRRYEEGHSVYEFYAYKFIGVDQTNGYSVYNLDPDMKAAAEKAGELVTINGKDYTYNYNYASREWCGSAIPWAYGSFNTAITWKNFTLSALFTYSLGGKVYDSSYATLMSTSSASSSQQNHKDILKSWTAQPAGMTEANRIDPDGIPIVDFERSKYNNAAGSRWLQDASYFVVKNINLGYRLPKRWTDKINVKGILLNASVENLVTITSLKGMNPQFSFNGESDDTYGTARVFNLGVTLDL